MKRRMAVLAAETRGDPVYLDYNATTPVDPRLLGDLDRLTRRQWGNSASLHIMGGEAFHLEEQARRQASSFFSKEEDSFQFCSSGCEGIGTILSSLAREGKHLITTAGEHSVLIGTAQREFKGRHTLLGIDGRGKMDLDRLNRALDARGAGSDPGAVLFYSPVNHETGAVQPVREIWEITRRRSVPVILDGVQAAIRLDPRDWAPYCQGFVVSGHKFHVPKGIALVQLDKTLNIRPSRFGGEDKDALFPGTANTPGISLLGRGLELMEQGGRTQRRILANLTIEGERILMGCRREIIRESPEDSVPGVLCFSLPGWDSMEKLFLHLGERRICVSRFSACTGSVEGESAVLKAMGVPARRASRSLRVSFGRFTTRKDFFALKSALESCQ